jgi:hypothetical protein
VSDSTRLLLTSSRESRNFEHLEQGPELLLGQNDVRFAFTKQMVSKRLWRLFPGRTINDLGAGLTEDSIRSVLPHPTSILHDRRMLRRDLIRQLDQPMVVFRT